MLGIVVGYGIAYYQFGFSISETPEQVVQAQDILSLNSIDQSGPALKIQSYDYADNLLKQATGVLIANPYANHPLLLTSLTNVYQANRLDIVARTAHTLNSVVAIDADVGLLLLDTNLSDKQALTASAENSLYLGRDILAVSPFEKVQGIVDSPAQRPTGQYYSYNIRLQQPLSSEFAALLDLGSGEMVGVIIARHESMHHYIAVDAAQIEYLVSRVGTDIPQNLKQFSRQFFLQTLPGNLVHIVEAAERGDWLTVSAAGKLLDAQDLVSQEHVASQLNSAYLHLASAAHATGRYYEVLSLLDEADRLLDRNPVRTRMRAKTLFEAGRPLESISALEGDIDQGAADESTFSLLQSLVLGEVASNNYSSVKKNDILSHAIARDAYFAPYHVNQGKLFYQQSRYAEALSSLNFAVQLDPELQIELQELMDAARQRLSNAGDIVVPLQKNENNVLVDVSVNGFSRRFVLDTGASLTVLSAKFAREIELLPVDSEFIVLNTANGVVRAPLATVDSIGLGNAIVRNVKVAILDNMGPVEGLLGLNFLNQFDIDIDHSIGEMILSRR